MKTSSITLRQQALAITATLVTLAACLGMLRLGRLHYFDLRSDPQVTVLDMLPRTTQGIKVTVDEVSENGRAKQTGADRVVHVSKGSDVIARGWAYDDLTHTPARAAAIQIDDMQTFPIAYGIARPDVARAFGQPALENVGWEARIPLDALSRLGRHRVSLVFVLADGIHAYKTPLLTIDESP